ncbi:MAG: pyridoxamine 5'-phosphate oxidase family protein [Mobilicoccus sp.]|nr:pyridoxamine 5'-phosphate oxidase family protein [Mobilicoccus sp.]
MALTLKQLAAKMREIDFCMLGTHAPYGKLAARPMSNNKDVEYDGTSRFFTWHDSQMVLDIGRTSHVMLNFSGDKGLFVCVQGEASVTTAKDAMREHWVDDLEQWFEDGIETDGICMITVDASTISYWSFEDGDGEIEV